MSKLEPEHTPPEQARDRAPSDSAEPPAPLQDLASVVGNRAFAGGVASTRGPEGAIGAGLQLHQLLRETADAHFDSAWQPKPPVRGGRGSGIQRLVPPGALIEALAQGQVATQGEQRAGGMGAQAGVEGAAAGLRVAGHAGLGPEAGIRGGAGAHAEGHAGIGAEAARQGGSIRDARALVSGLASAVSTAWATWQQTATIAGVVVNGVTAIGGTMIGLPVQPLVLALGPKGSEVEIRVTGAVAAAFGAALAEWQSTVTFRGLPMFPSFAAVPSPTAPPTPGVPFPLIAVAPNPSAMAGLGEQMAGAFGDPSEPAGAAVCRSIGSAISTVFSLWLATTQITNLLGTGPVPTFAPPYVPVGPVVGGTAMMPPGGLV